MAKKVNIITLGCSKNLVDSEVLMRQLSKNGFEVSHESVSGDTDYVIINTCGFIGDAKEESIETILDFSEAKDQGQLEKILVFGCLSERYKEELRKEIPEVDEWFGKFELPKMLASLGAEHYPNASPNRIITTPSHYAYLKIAEGCNRTCSFCAIPNITGKYQSKPFNEVIDEAKSLIKQGVKEIILIAQDLSYYGIDIEGKPLLAQLMEELAQLEGLGWLRIHYTYPARFPVEILPVMNKYPKICSYMDIALQHISDNMLKLMRRNINKSETYDLINTFRQEVPGIALRTTLLVGHPGETEEDFEALKQFVKEVRFERLGVFAYSHEEHTYAHKRYADDIPEKVKQQRVEEIMEIQQEISFQVNLEKKGKTFDVLIDRREGEYFIGRTEFDSPEVDDEVLVTPEPGITVGEFYPVKITDVDDYDLYGILDKSAR